MDPVRDRGCARAVFLPRRQDQVYDDSVPRASACRLNGPPAFAVRRLPHQARHRPGGSGGLRRGGGGRRGLRRECFGGLQRLPPFAGQPAAPLLSDSHAAFSSDRLSPPRQMSLQPGDKVLYLSTIYGMVKNVLDLLVQQYQVRALLSRVRFTSAVLVPSPSSPASLRGCRECPTMNTIAVFIVFTMLIVANIVFIMLHSHRCRSNPAAGGACHGGRRCVRLRVGGRFPGGRGRDGGGERRAGGFLGVRACDKGQASRVPLHSIDRHAGGIYRLAGQFI